MSLNRYIVLPAFGLRSLALAESQKLRVPGPVVRLSERPAVRMAAGRASLEGPPATMQVLDSMFEDGPKLCEMTPEAVLNLRAEIPGLRVVPVVRYSTMRAIPEVNRPAPSAKNEVQIKVVDAGTGAPVEQAHVIVFTNYRSRAGREGRTDSDGIVSLAMDPGTKTERVYVYGPSRYWGFYEKGMVINDVTELKIRSIDLASGTLLLGQMYGDLPGNAGKGIRVGIIDTGVAKQHPALPNVQGVNMVFDETQDNPGASADWGPAAHDGEHGTHVAGIVGMRPYGSFPLRGVAPGVELRSYRVFPNSGEGATNYDILSAIMRAVSDGCHILNLSLGGGGEDEALRTGIVDALSAGTLVVAAAGNDSRKPVSFPASIETCVAVSAMGRANTCPVESTETADVTNPYGNPDRSNYVAAFSNFGPQIDLTGPGAGIVSTLPDATYGVMSGTSMACPAITGFAAYLLAANPDVLALTGSDRTTKLKSLLADCSKPFGFGRDYEGFGSPSLAITRVGR